LLTCCLLLLLLLQYLDGPEVDCDLVVSEGRIVYGAVTDNWPTVGSIRGVWASAA
jgi:hypothetical protein